jgi:hypothetical protein
MGDKTHRTLRKLIALAVLGVIVLAGTLLFSRFFRDVAIMKCITAGRQDCVERIDAASPSNIAGGRTRYKALSAARGTDSRDRGYARALAPREMSRITLVHELWYACLGESFF